MSSKPLMEKGRVWPVVLLAGLALAGCVSQPSAPGSLVGEGRGNPVGDDISGFLAQAPAGAVMQLAESPWGRNVQLTADIPYYAASGTECRRVQVIGPSQAVRDALACATPSGWTSRRLVTGTSPAGGQ
jgi:hypothetical protein